MLATAAAGVREQPSAQTQRVRPGDFLLLGGSSLLLLPLVLLLPLQSKSVVAVMVFVALIVNNPHFANSYQLFYRGFSGRLATPGVQRRRYLYAGILVPAVLIAYLGYCFVSRNLTAMGLAADAMAFFVGWHYVKQGYGMLMVDSARQRRFFSTMEKRVLLANSYAVWFLTWIITNGDGQTRNLKGIHFYTFKLPAGVEEMAIGLTIATSLALGVMLWRRLTSKAGLPVTGIVAYLVTLYLWMVAVHISPIWLLIVPALHSLQYLAIVWRFEGARARDTGDVTSEGSVHGWTKRFVLFLLNGFALGVAAFWVVPVLLDVSIPGAASIGSGKFFLFAFWVFINIHHYFIDSVMWRSENADVKRYLFAPATAAAATAKVSSTRVAA